MEKLNSTSLDIDLAYIRDELKLILLRMKAMTLHKDRLLKQLNDATEVGQQLNEKLNKLLDKEMKLIKEKEVQAHQFIEDSHDRTRHEAVSLGFDDSLLSETKYQEPENMCLTREKQKVHPRRRHCLLSFCDNDKLLKPKGIKDCMSSGLNDVAHSSEKISSDVTPEANVRDNIVQNDLAQLGPYFCPSNGISCITKGDLNRHMQNESCKQKCKSSKLNSVSHNRNVKIKIFNPKLARYGCPVCRFTSCGKGSLSVHMKQRGCEQKYRSRSGIKDGSLPLKQFEIIPPETVAADNPIQNLKSKLQMYSCPICQYSCTCKRNFFRHMRTRGCEEKYKSLGLKDEFLPTDVSKIIPPDTAIGIVADKPIQNLMSKLRRFSCPICRFSCTFKRNLFNHMRRKGCEEKYLSADLNDVSDPLEKWSTELNAFSHPLNEFSTELNDASEPMKELSTVYNVSDPLNVSKDVRSESIVIDCIVQNFKSNLPLYSCPVCCKNFSTKVNLFSHIRNKICKLNKSAIVKKKPIVVSADYSELKFRFRSEQVLPILLVKPNVNSFTCYICRKTTENDTSGEHRRDTGKDICETCEKRLPELSRSRNNEDETDETVGKLFKCKTCNRSFSDRSLLLKHIRLHSAERPHVCTRCGKSYLSSGGLKYHMNDHDSVNLLKCKICSKTLKGNNSLNGHMLLHSRAMDFTCSVCGKGFAMKYSLKLHMRVHTGERPYCCSYCDKTFTMSSHLRSHISSHTGVKLLVCKVCSKRFRLHTALNKHVKIHIRKGELE